MTLSPVMLDIETLGTVAGSVIVSIGATKFSWVDGSAHDSFYINVSVEDSVNNGLRIDRNTVDWWGKQSTSAREAWLKDPQDMVTAFTAFSDWFGDKKHEVWANGMNFDFPLLESAYRAVKMKTPWEYSRLNDMRTIVNMFNARGTFRNFRADNPGAVYHNALDDCNIQSKFLAKLIGESKQ